jgi:hypothetical protein
MRDECLETAIKPCPANATDGLLQIAEKLTG